MREKRRNIAELPQQTADKIAAGEVIERPLSIVKELVENSVDAGASSIAVEIKNGGKSYIRVTDDGHGIPHDETELAFKRHATSKLRTAKDLNSIETLGFRGEALASIAAVSRTELISKTSEEKVGTSIVIEGGNTAAISETGCPSGTTIIVKDLFYNTPARLKFLKKDNAESALIIEFMSKMALAYPHIRMRLINNSNTLFSTPGRGDRFTAIATVYDPQTAKKLIKIEASGEKGMVLEGYISPPNETRANRKNQIFFVNGRYIQSKLMEECVSEGYREKLFEGRHPIVFLFMSINPELTDVNIHPNKKEIRFDQDDPVREFLVSAIKRGLKVQEAVPEIVFKRDRQKDGSSDSKKEERKSYQFPKQNQEQIDIRKILREKRAEEERAVYGRQESGGESGENTGGAENFDRNGNNRNNAGYIDGNIKNAGGAGNIDGSIKNAGGAGYIDGSIKNAGGAGYIGESDESADSAGYIGGSDRNADSAGDVTDRDEKRIDNIKDSDSPDRESAGNGEYAGAGGYGNADDSGSDNNMSRYGSVAENEIKTEKGVFIPIVKKAEKRPFEVSEIRPAGTLFASYILGCDDDVFYIIDQHAAHERVFYEKLTREFYGQQTASQMMVIPLNIEVSHSVKNAENDWIDFIRRIGFTIEEFGPKSYAVKEIPMYMDLSEAESFLKDFFDSLEEMKSFRDVKRAEKIILKACKSAVKANNALNPEEVNRLISDLAKTENPFSCPHGRPTIIKMTKREIENLFKR